MRRKDLLIIVAVLIVITFLTVLGIHIVLNEDNIFAKVKNEIQEIASSKKEKHSNGWETAIVDKIIHDVPIPVGFTYIEGDAKTGLVIEDNKTQERYMWIPDQEVDEDIYNAVLANMDLEATEEGSRENIQKYGGFYVAIGEEKETVSQEEYESLKLLNKSQKTAVETHLVTTEEAMLINQMAKDTEIEINVKELRTMTVLSAMRRDHIEERSKKIKEKGWDENLIGDITEDGVPIPKGFIYEEGNVKTGLKIKNSNNLSFIWIPVEFKDGKIIDVKEEILEKMEGKVEVDTVEAYKTYKDGESEEYNALVASIEKYGGFYISEAELGYDKNGFETNKYRGMEKYYTQDEEENKYEWYYINDGDYYRNVNEENLKESTKTELAKVRDSLGENGILTYEKAIEKSKMLYDDSETVVSHLTYGLEYDATILYLLKSGAITTEEAFDDSTEIGKYEYLEESKYTKEEHYNIYESAKYLNGIYGLAGNLAEITQEKDTENKDKIITRGGSWATYGNSETISSAASVNKDKIEEKIGSTGFRACLYIKTDYTPNQDLAEAKSEAKISLKNHIEEVGNKTSNFNKSKTAEGLYENSALNDIVKYIEERIDEETSTTSLNKIVAYGKEQIDIIAENIIAMLDYPKGINHDEYYGDKKAECDKIKEQAIKDMQNVHWDLENITDWAGNETSYLNIRQIAENNIEEIRGVSNNQNIYDAEIEGYINEYHPEIAEKEWVKIIKQRAKEEMNETLGEENLLKVAEKYQGIIEVMFNFDDVYNHATAYYEDWEPTKTKWLEEIAKNTQNKEEAQSKINEAKTLIDRIIEEKSSGETPVGDEKPTNEPENVDGKNQYQIDIENAKKNGYQIYKSSENIDESKLGTFEEEGKTWTNTLEDVKVWYIYYTIDEKPCEVVVIPLNDYKRMSLERDEEGFIIHKFSDIGTAKFRVYKSNGAYKTIQVTVTQEQECLEPLFLSNNNLKGSINATALFPDGFVLEDNGVCYKKKNESIGDMIIYGTKNAIGKAKLWDKEKTKYYELIVAQRMDDISLKNDGKDNVPGYLTWKVVKGDSCYIKQKGENKGKIYRFKRQNWK